VLLSAYACEPNRGSEPGVGWNWSIEVARLGHEVHVLTRANNRAAIEAVRGSLPPSLKFHYYDPGRWATFWKRGTQGLTLFYLLWQLGAARRAAELHSREKFDLVHHLTLGSIKLPTFMSNLGIPLILGPVGGGETAPWRLRAGYSARGKMSDALRDVGRILAKLNPMISYNLDRSRIIALRTPENLDFVRESARQNVVYVSDVGAPPPTATPGEARSAYSGELRLLYVGRFLHWKGLYLALGAAKILQERNIAFRLVLVGRGPEEDHLRKLARRHGIEDQIEWRGWMAHAELTIAYQQSDVFLFPSLHDSGGSVVLEAMAHGLPVVCLDTGGPALLVSETCGVKIPVVSRSSDDVAELLASAVQKLAGNPEMRGRLRLGALAQAEARSWKATVSAFYSIVAIAVA
jgi:glycosyltransferase involved in cell wall biosynthesis